MMKKQPKFTLVVFLLATVLMVACGAGGEPVKTAVPPSEPQPVENGEFPVGSAEFVNGIRMIAEGVYETEGSEVLFAEPAVFDERLQKSLDGKIVMYERLLNDHPDLNFYAFYLELIEASPQNPLNADFPNADAGRSYEYFLANKPQGLRLDTLPLTSFDDHLKYYFRTDHHWNVHGMMAGYEKIHAMLAENYPQISPMYTHDRFYTFPDIGFVGTWARKAGYQARPEPFEVALYDLPPYTNHDSSGNEVDVNHMDEYLAGEYSHDFYADHYIDYYREDKIGYLEYVSENGSDRNLLLIGDSFSNPLEPLLASHYHHTYAVDIRRLPDYHFSMSEFLSEHEVDDVLFLGGASVIFYEWQWTVQP